jgi:hypothetical protein
MAAGGAALATHPPPTGSMAGTTPGVTRSRVDDDASIVSGNELENGVKPSSPIMTGWSSTFFKPGTAREVTRNLVTTGSAGRGVLVN